MPAVELDPLFGRAADLDRIERLIADSRLVTLSGPGGSGKTRLARAVVDGVETGGSVSAFVDLSAIDVDELIAPTILATLRADPTTEDPVQAVASALSGGEALLALDNLEHLSGAAAVVAELLAAAPSMRVLATSRRRLGLSGELEVAVAPLSLPEADGVDAVESSAAGALFLARARALGRIGTLDQATAADVAALLNRLDGLPLALELAAARTRVMSPAEILRRLDSHGLTAVDRSAEGPRRSLAAILDWTLGLLTPDERDLINALVVCAGFDLDMAQGLVPEQDVVDALDELVALGLVQTSAPVLGSSRFRLLETVRAEVRDRQEADDLVRSRRRHADVVVGLVAAQPSGSRSDPQWIERLDVDAENIRRALDFLEQTEPDLAIQFWNALFDFWQTRGRTSEAIERFERLTRVDPEPTRELAAAMSLHVSLVSGLRGNLSVAEANRRAWEVARAVGDRSSEVHALDVMALNARDQGDKKVAVEVLAALDQIEPDLTELSDRMYASQARYFVTGAIHGDLSDEALAALIASTNLSVESGGRDSSIVSLGNLALCYLWRDEPGAALPQIRRAHELAAAVDHRFRGWIELLLAQALAGTDNSSEAVDALTRAVQALLKEDKPIFLTDALCAAIAVEVAAGRPLEAARAWGCLLAAIDGPDVDFSPEDRRLAERWFARARRGAPALDVELAIHDGAASTPVDLLRSLLAGLTKPSDEASRNDRPAPKSSGLRHGTLTRREIEILTMVGQGRSDPQIAEVLFISPKTASVHVANIKAKLGLDSRLEVALRARDMGLVSGDA